MNRLWLWLSILRLAAKIASFFVGKKHERKEVSIGDDIQERMRRADHLPDLVSDDEITRD